MFWKEILYYLTFPALIYICWQIILFVLKRYEQRINKDDVTEKTT